MKSIKIFRRVAVVLALSTLFFAAGIQSALAEPVWIDVRSAEEYAGDHLTGATNIPHTEIAEKISSLDLAKDSEIKLYCRSGVRAGMAKQALEELGYSNVENVGGLADAKKAVGQEE